MARCMYLEIEPPKFSHDCRDYDLARKLQYTDLGCRFDPHKTKTLHEYAHLFNIPVESEYRGNNIQELFEVGNWEEIVKHSNDDVRITQTLYNKLTRKV